MDTLTHFLLGLVSFSLLLYQNISSIINMKKSRKTKETPIYLFHEGLIFAILEVIRLKLRIIQFPKEDKLKKDLLEAMKRITEKSEHDSTQK